MSIAKVLLSGSVGGRQIKVAATATPGTVVHITPASASVIDQVTLFAVNTSALPVALTVEWGGTDPDDRIKQTIPAQVGPVLVVPQLPLSGDGSTGRAVRAFAATADVLMILGDVNRIG